MPKVTFNNKQNDFYITLKQRVDAYFKENKIDKTGDWRLFHKAIVLFTVAIFSYVAAVNYINWGLPIGVAVLLCAVLGFAKASIGFNVMHDACHGSYSKNDTLNNIMGYSLNALGSVCFFWKQKHNIIHHTYTNVEGVDDDIAKAPLIRHCYEQKWLPIHRAQHFYLPIIYFLSSIFWVFLMDFQKYFSGKINNTERWKMDFKEHTIFWLSKVYYVTVFIIIPIYMVGGWAWFTGFMIYHGALGFTLAIVFQLAHVVEHTEFAAAHDDLFIDESWAKFQIKTTANFARTNKLVNWYVGGLNFQIEHHLFPKISHVHYPAISDIVKETCKDYDLLYNDFPTMWSAVKSHFKMMKEFGQNPVKPELVGVAA